VDRKQKTRNEPPIVMGTASPGQAGDFVGKIRRAWLFVTRVRKGTTKAQGISSIENKSTVHHNSGCSGTTVAKAEDTYE
ncbi:hypothetical protein HHI36_002458, partial [Cryptolaemus montrouzieri]